MKKLFNFKNLLLLLIFTLPLYIFRIRIAFFSTNLWEISLGVIFVFWLFKAWPKINLEEAYKNHMSFILPSAAIFIGFVISTLASGNYLHGLGIIKSWFLVPIAFTIMAGSVFRQNIGQVYTAYFFSAAGVAALSIFYLFFGNLTYDRRLEAFFNSPNYLAMYLAPAIIIAGIKKYKSKFRILLDGISIFVIVISLYFTYSYAGWLAVIISLSAVFYLNHRIKARKLLVGFILLIGLIVILQLNSNKFSVLADFSARSSFASRVAIWKSAGKILKDNWLIGIGPGNFQAVYLEYQKYFRPYPEWAVPHPHNIYLSFWLYGGILGIFGFFWLIYAYFRGFLEKVKKAGDNLVIQNVLIASCGIMIYILLHGLFDTTYFKNDLAVVFWLAFLALI